MSAGNFDCFDPSFKPSVEGFYAFSIFVILVHLFVCLGVTFLTKLSKLRIESCHSKLIQSNENGQPVTPDDLEQLYHRVVISSAFKKFVLGVVVSTYTFIFLLVATGTISDTLGPCLSNGNSVSDNPELEKCDLGAISESSTAGSDNYLGKPPPSVITGKTGILYFAAVVYWLILLSVDIMQFAFDLDDTPSWKAIITPQADDHPSIYLKTLRFAWSKRLSAARAAVAFVVKASASMSVSPLDSIDIADSCYHDPDVRQLFHFAIYGFALLLSPVLAPMIGAVIRIFISDKCCGGGTFGEVTGKWFIFGIVLFTAGGVILELVAAFHAMEHSFLGTAIHRASVGTLLPVVTRLVNHASHIAVEIAHICWVHFSLSHRNSGGVEHHGGCDWSKCLEKFVNPLTLNLAPTPLTALADKIAQKMRPVTRIGEQEDDADAVNIHIEESGGYGTLTDEKRETGGCSQVNAEDGANHGDEEANVDDSSRHWMNVPQTEEGDQHAAS